MMTKAFLLVEDETLIRMMIADMIEELGHVVAAEAGTIDKAISFATTSAFDIAILDVDVDGSRVTPVADVLAKRKIPFLFASGYGSGGIPESFSDRPVLRKPFQLEQLERSVRSLLSATDETIA